MMSRRNQPRRGSLLLEFTFVGIPLMFVLISLFELSRGMWTYHTVAAAVKAGTRYVVVHGQNCNIVPNACTVTVAQIAGRMKSAGPGLLPERFSLTFTPASGDPISCSLSDCLSNSTTWPPAAANAPGMDVTISGTYPFFSVISMFWPGAGAPTGLIGTTNFGAASKERMQF